MKYDWDEQRRCPLLGGQLIEGGRCFELSEIALSKQPDASPLVDQLQKVAFEQGVSFEICVKLCSCHARFIGMTDSLVGPSEANHQA